MIEKYSPYPRWNYFMQGPTTVAATSKARLSAGVVVVNLSNRKLHFLLLRAYRNWDFPKGMVESGEAPIDAALRELLEETSIGEVSFDWGPIFMETGPYRKDKVARYYIARSKQRHVELKVNPQLGFPEHQEACWVNFEKALSIVSLRLKPVVQWAHATIFHVPVQP
jgi:8-oxo-dGTP pyrophosphatase MutT (NUDIX family)